MRRAELQEMGRVFSVALTDAEGGAGTQMPFNVLDQPATSEPPKSVEKGVCYFNKRQDGWQSRQMEKQDLSHVGDKANCGWPRRRSVAQVAE